METAFVPLLVHNNAGGADAALLKRYREPSWNNPVVRFFAADGTELLPRKGGVWSSERVAARMVAALAQAGGAPKYLELAAEGTARRTERATFAMHCFWVGEARLGALDGVLATRAGWLDGREVVEVVFAPDRLRYAALVERARALDCAGRVYAHTDDQLAAARKLAGDLAVRTDARARDAKAADRRYHLRKSPLRFVPLTPLQATRANAALAARRDPAALLSPRQAALHGEIRARLAADAAALDGLARPETVAALPAYAAALRARLAGD